MVRYCRLKIHYTVEAMRQVLAHQSRDEDDEADKHPPDKGTLRTQMYQFIRESPDTFLNPLLPLAAIVGTIK